VHIPILEERSLPSSPTRTASRQLCVDVEMSITESYWIGNSSQHCGGEGLRNIHDMI
jgi:hypothetical protein